MRSHSLRVRTVIPGEIKQKIICFISYFELQELLNTKQILLLVADPVRLGEPCLPGPVKVTKKWLLKDTAMPYFIYLQI